MGCYDFFIGKCPKCGRAFECQTKLAECRFRTMAIGADVKGICPSGRIRTKSPCACGCYPVVVIKRGKIVAFEDGPADRQEGLGGILYEDGNRPKDEFERLLPEHLRKKLKKRA